MIDNPLQAHLLMAKLKAALPLPALATPPLLAQLHEQAPGRDLSPRCQITEIYYAGDEGGILCKLDFGQEDADPVFFVSITHLCNATEHIASKATARFTSCRLRLMSSDRTVLRCGGDPGPTTAPGARAEHQGPQLSSSRSGRGPQAVPCLSLTLPSAEPRKGRCRRNS